MKNTRVQHFDILKTASLATARMRPQDLLDEKNAGISDSSLLVGVERNTRKEYLLNRRFTPFVGDVPFDHASVRRIAVNQVAGDRTLILSYQVPPGTDMIVTQFSFFIAVNTYNPNPWPRELAYPLEFANYLSFDMQVNGKSPIVATNYFNTVDPIPNLNRSGFIILSKDPESFSPSYDGMHFVAQKGSKLTIEVVCLNNMPAWASRDPYTAGSHIRGFLTNSEDLDRMNK